MKTRKKGLWVLPLAALLAGIFFLSFLIGRYRVPALQVLRLLTDRFLSLISFGRWGLAPTWTAEEASVVVQIRLPRILSAALIGAAPYIFGGGHVGTALAPVLASVGFRVVIYDNRPDFAKPDHYPSAEQVILGDYLDIGAHLTLTENDYVCIMTPGHQADREVLLQALRSPATYIGCIGSRHKIAATNAYLMANGIPEADLSRVHAPIGLEIYGQTPAEIAVSVAAEMIRHRALRAGTDKKPSKG